MDDNRQKLIKTLRDLEYRIQVTPENVPERAAAIRLRDRLLEKHGLTLADILVKSSDDKTDHMAPGFGLKEQMEAAAYLSDIVMPNNYVEAERKAIEGPRG